MKSKQTSLMRNQILITEQFKNEALGNYTKLRLHFLLKFKRC